MRTAYRRSAKSWPCIDGPLVRRTRTHHEVLDLALELQQILGILRIIFRNQQLVSRESTNRLFRLP